MFVEAARRKSFGLSVCPKDFELIDFERVAESDVNRLLVLRSVISAARQIETAAKFSYYHLANQRLARRFAKQRHEKSLDWIRFARREKCGERRRRESRRDGRGRQKTIFQPEQFGQLSVGERFAYFSRFGQCGGCQTNRNSLDERKDSDAR